MSRSPYLLSDTAKSCFQPLIDLSDSKFKTLTAQAPLHWLQTKQYNDFGAAMHLVHNWRQLLSVGGLPIEATSYTKISFKNERANELLDISGECGFEETIIAVRLLMYLGLYRDAEMKLKNCHGAQSENHLVWVQYLLGLCESLRGDNSFRPDKLSEKVGALKDADFELIAHVGPFLVSQWLNLGNAEKAKSWYSKTLKHCDEATAPDEFIKLTKARLNRHSSRIALKSADTPLFEKEISKALSFIQESIPCSSFLMNEQSRRIHDFAATSFLRLGSPKTALEHALIALQLDPFCSRANMIAADCALAVGKNDDAARYYLQGSTWGIVERPYCQFMLGCLNAELEFDAGVIEGLTADVYHSSTLPALARRKLKSLPKDSWTRTQLIDLLPESSLSDASLYEGTRPLQVVSVKTFANANGGSGINGSSEIYQRYLPFWELRNAEIKSVPLTSTGPLLAWEVFLQDSDPWFHSLYLQRALNLNFRIELAHACAFHQFSNDENKPAGMELASLRGFSDNMGKLHDAIQQSSSLSVMKRCRLARVVGALGFHREALEVLPQSVDTSKAEGVYALYTKIFMRHVAYGGTDPHIAKDLLHVYKMSSNKPETIRVQLSCAVLGAVICGQRKDITGTKFWRTEGLSWLEELMKDNHFNDFEKSLLQSRCYRSVSYAPFLEKDFETLRRDKEICESSARQITPASKTQQVFFLENMFPMLESVARMEFALGNHDRGMALMKEIVHTIDPYDSKAWVQYGDLLNEHGETDQALVAYLKAARLGPPIARISWFKAARCLERSGDLLAAKRCYLRSLKIYPMGFTPLLDLLRVADKSRDTHLKHWVLQGIESAKSSGKMAPEAELIFRDILDKVQDEA